MINLNPKIEHIEIDKLNPDENNPNKFSALMQQSLDYSVEKYGSLQLIIIDQDNNIIDGNHRYFACKNKGVKDVDVIRVNIENKSDRYLISQAMNKIRGSHDLHLDAQIMKDLINEDEKNILELVRLTAAESDKDIWNLINGSLEDEHTNRIVQEVDPFIRELKDLKPVVKEGDIFLLGNHKLLCGDCTKQENINKLVQGKTIDLLLTDPPYGIGIIKSKLNSIGGDKPITIKGVSSNRGNTIVKANLYRPIIGDDKPFNPSHLLGLAKHSILFGANYYADKLPISSCWITWLKKELEWDRTTFADCELVWTDFDIPSRVYSVIWMGLIKEGEHDKRIHPTQKPVKLLTNLIKDFSKENDIVLDTYLGSGSTLIACEETERICYGMEIDPLYCQVIIERWQKLTGK